MARPRRSAAPDFAALAEKEALFDQAIARVARGPTAEELKKKRLAQEAAAQRKAAREAAAAAAAMAAPLAEVEPEEEEEASDSEGEECRIEQLLVCRTFAARAKFVLVKWRGFMHEKNTWQERKHLHAGTTSGTEAGRRALLRTRPTLRVGACARACRFDRCNRGVRAHFQAAGGALGAARTAAARRDGGSGSREAAAGGERRRRARRPCGRCAV
jgi:hypothetical protein